MYKLFRVLPDGDPGTRAFLVFHGWISFYAPKTRWRSDAKLAKLDRKHIRGRESGLGSFV